MNKQNYFTTKLNIIFEIMNHLDCKKFSTTKSIVQIKKS